MTNLTSTSTATSITITWTVTGFIDRFEVSYRYTVNACTAPAGPLRGDTITDSSRRSHTLSGLNEDSEYTITVTAVNDQGSSMGLATVSTATAGISDTSLGMASQTLTNKIDSLGTTPYTESIMIKSTVGLGSPTAL